MPPPPHQNVNLKTPWMREPGEHGRSPENHAGRLECCWLWGWYWAAESSFCAPLIPLTHLRSLVFQSEHSKLEASSCFVRGTCENDLLKKITEFKSARERSSR